MFSEEDLSRMVGMKRAGISTTEIARRFNTTKSRVRRATLKLGAYTNLNHQPGRQVFKLGIHKIPEFKEDRL